MGGLANVNAETTDITEINLTGNYQYGTVPAGVLPTFNPSTTTDSITIGLGNSGWSYYYGRNWRGFGGETPVAYNDGKTKYGYFFQVKPKEGYQLASSNLKVIYNGEDVTSTAEVSRWPWGAYVTVDLGKAIGENPNTYKVTFNSNGGTEIPPKEVVSGEKINEPSKPTKDKYLFRGWYEDATFSTKFDFYNTPITSDMTLYAKWEAANSINEVELAGDYQYGTVPVGTLPSFNPRTMTDSITIDKSNSRWMYKMENGNWSGFGSDTPVAYNDGKTDYGYIFHVAPNDGYQLASSNLKVIYNGEDVTSTAQVSRWPWGAYVTVDLGKANETPVVYTVTFNSNDGTEVAPQNVNAGEKLTEPTPAPTKVGFTFDGWYEDSTFSKKFDFNKPITGNITLYAKWVENKYTLIFDANGGSGSMAPKADLTGEYTLPSNEFTAPSGKQFKGWSLTADGAIVTKVEMTENKTVYAIWEDIPVVTYTVTFNSNDGTEVAPQNVNAGEKLTEPTPAPTKAGFTFDGWYEDSTFSKKFDFNKPITGNITLYAKWVENKYTLTFDANGGSGSMAPKADLTGEYILPSNEFTAPSGKQFKGWSLTADGAIVTKVEMTENKTVYAIWEDIPVATYTVTFNSNDGTEVVPQNVNAGEKLTEPTPAPTKAGFTFDGWYEDSTFSKKFDFNTPITGNITLYAKWVENKYTLTFDANGGSGSMAPKADLTGEYTLPSNEFTAPSGKQFKGWSLTADGAIVTKVEMTENKTVYAIWEDMYSYRFLEGTGEQTIDGKAKSFKLVIDADENKFVSLEIDGALYQKNIDYTVQHGSTIIDFTSAGLAKLNALSKGDYDVTLTFTDGVINGKLHVTAANPTVTPQKPNTDNPKPNTDSPKSNTNNVKNNPKTYDGTFSYIEILLVVILCLISVVIIGKKRSRNY